MASGGGSSEAGADEFAKWLVGDYEIGAWAAHGLFDSEGFTFDELIAHMAIDFAASAAGATLLVIWDRAGWQTRRVPAAQLTEDT